MPKFEDLTGQHFYKLTVLYRADDYIQPSGQHKRMWHCKCECGNECDVRASDLKSGNTRSCGCFQQESRGKNNFDDLTGQSFGNLVVLDRLPNHITASGQTKTKWRCKCACGKICEVYASQLKNGLKSCGCHHEEEKRLRKIARDIVKREEKEKIQEIKNSIKNGISIDKIDDGLKKYVDKYQKQHIKAEERKMKRRLSDEVKKQKKIEYLKTNSLAAQYPDLIAEWHPSKNGKDTPYDISKGSNKKVWWICSKGHEWEAVVSSRANGNSCPICSGYKLWKGFNDLESQYPELLREWDYEKNNIDPSEIKYNSPKKVWWRCPLGHSFDMSVINRTGNQKCGCPYCCTPAKRVLKGFNDLAFKCPDIAREWHPTKNGNLTPDKVLCGSAKKVWWLGPCGHEYKQGIANRVNGGNCPYCSHQKLLKGFNDFETTNPELLAEWDYEKNEVLPSEIGVGTHRKIWWICPFGHSYQSYPSNRCGNKHSGCSVCDKENHTSFPEQALYYYVKKYFPDAVNSDRNAVGMELDIFIPSLSIAIEYDGYRWHKSSKSEQRKNKLCNDNNILLMRIREEGLDIYDDCYCIVRENIRSNNSLTDVIKKVLLDINNKIDFDIDVDRDAMLIYSSYIVTRKSQSLSYLFPDISKEWHPTKNGLLTPEMVAPQTNKKVWWSGKCGHEWQSTVTSRTHMKAGCPICSGKRVLSGFNDLKTVYPELCDSWDYMKNDKENIFPDKVTIHSDKQVWWKCNICGNEWEQKVDVVVRSKERCDSNGCPKCGMKINAKAKYKAVINIDTGEIFESVKEAALRFSISPSYISAVCKGKYKSAKGTHWRYVETKDDITGELISE